MRRASVSSASPGLAGLADALLGGVKDILARRSGARITRPRMSCERPPNVAVDDLDCPESEAGAHAGNTGLLWRIAHSPHGMGLVAIGSGRPSVHGYTADNLTSERWNPGELQAPGLIRQLSVLAPYTCTDKTSDVLYRAPFLPWVSRARSVPPSRPRSCRARVRALLRWVLGLEPKQPRDALNTLILRA